MARLSDALNQIKKQYEVVVIGSGYAGGVAASRLARAGRQVCVLERGLERQPSEFPNSSLKMVKETQMDMPGRHIGSDTGLFHLRMNDDISVFQACGLGGTSLINGGVSLRVLPRILLDERWPEEFRRDLNDRSQNDSPYGKLEGHYRLAERMLKPRTWPENFPRLLKMEAMQKVAAAQKLPFARVPIAVNFDEQKGGVNEFGVPQRPCIACGDCAAGCNHTAKNTLMVNYLPDAKNHGAEIYSGVGVHHVEKKDGSWMLHCRTSGKAGSDILISADVVVLAAGTLGTNEILLRSRERSLPLSDQLGTRFSGNGDLVGWSYNTNYTINAFGFGKRSPQNRAPVGPFASSIIDNREEHDYLIIEGSFPGGMVNGIAALLSVLNFSGVDMRGNRTTFRRNRRGPQSGGFTDESVFGRDIEDPDLPGCESGRWVRTHVSGQGRGADFLAGYREGRCFRTVEGHAARGDQNAGRQVPHATQRSEKRFARTADRPSFGRRLYVRQRGNRRGQSQRRDL